jgi:hypothetical protein
MRKQRPLISSFSVNLPLGRRRSNQRRISMTIDGFISFLQYRELIELSVSAGLGLIIDVPGLRVIINLLILPAIDLCSLFTRVLHFSSIASVNLRDPLLAIQGQEPGASETDARQGDDPRSIAPTEFPNDETQALKNPGPDADTCPISQSNASPYRLFAFCSVHYVVYGFALLLLCLFLLYANDVVRLARVRLRAVGHSPFVEQLRAWITDMGRRLSELQLEPELHVDLEGRVTTGLA